MIGIIIEVLKWIGIILLILLAIGIMLAVGLFIILFIQVLREPEPDDNVYPSICTLDDGVCYVPDGTPCSCCEKYHDFERQGKLS